ncbi:AP-3 complex subunit delta [Actinomortierella ambigua]|nr:AP-3 complex subunit delta [Actinomortierella ambigua]
MSMSSLFSHSLTDLIRGLRHHKKDEQAYIAKEITNIRKELRSNDTDLKAQAIAKLTYLQMMGYDMSWASFHVVEVMSSPKFLYKGIGYLGAIQSFDQNTDVLMLTTNLIKKDLASSQVGEIGVALTGLAHILTPDLARDLCADLVAMLNHSRPIVRKKVLLVLYKVFLKYPEGLRLSFPRMKERLDDPDPAVVSAAVTVICELARRNPKNYLSLAPQLFRLLTTSSNYWMMIKIIKLFAALTPHEPRLAKKLLPPIRDLIQTTPSMSLLYECIHAVISGGMLVASGSGSNAESAAALAATCVSKLRTFLEDPDQNLQYLGLLALTKILPTHPHLLADHKDVILKFLDDQDISIRLRALDLIVGMANKRNLPEIVKRLVVHLLPLGDEDTNADAMDTSYRTDIVRRIVFICSQNSYANVANFEWYLAVLSDLTNLQRVDAGELLMNQFMDVGVRVKTVRPYTVKLMMRLLADSKLIGSVKQEDSNAMVLFAAAWLTGEYCALLESPLEALEHLSHKEAIHLPPAVQAVYLQSMIKVFAYWMNGLQHDWNEQSREMVCEMVDTLRINIREMYGRNDDLEVQERACNIAAILDVVAEHLPRTPLRIENSISFAPTLPSPPSILGKLYPLFFQQELNPVAPKAQRKVPIPEGLDLDRWIYEPVPDPVSESSDDDDFMNEHELSSSYGYGWTGGAAPAGKSRKSKSRKGKSSEADTKEDSEGRDKRKAERKARQKLDPYYIGGDDSRDSSVSSKGRRGAAAVDDEDDMDVESIPIVQLSIDEFSKPIKVKKSKKGKDGKKSKRRQESSLITVPVEFATEEMPENAVLSNSDDEGAGAGAMAASAGATKKGNGFQVYGGSKDSSVPTIRGILDADHSELHSVDLSVPLGADEHLPRTKAYMNPEEARQHAEAQAQQQRLDAIKAKKEKKEKKEKKKAPKGEKEKKKSSKKEKGATAAAAATTGAPLIDVAEELSPARIPLPVSPAPQTIATPEVFSAKATASPPAVEEEEKSKKTKKTKKSKETTDGAETTTTPKSKKSTKSKKSASSGSASSKAAAVIVPFPERTDLALAQDAYVEMTYGLAMSPASLAVPTLPGQETEHEPLVVATIKVKTLEAAIESAYISLADSFDVRLGGTQSGKESISAKTLMVPGHGGETELELELLVTGRIRYELQVMGTLHYAVQGMDRELEFVFSVAPSTFMLSMPRLTGAEFSKVLTEQPETFAATGSVSVTLSGTGTNGQDEAFWSAVERITRDITHTHVVEVVEGAASFFGRAWQGYQVAGLIKAIKSADEDHTKRLDVEMKCTDQGFVDGLVQEIDAVGSF